MFTLIKRELEESFVFLLLAAIVAGLTVMLIIAGFYYGEDHERIIAIVPSFVFSGVMILLFGWLGVDQIYGDKNKHMNSFLCTLAVSRLQVFAAKIITGIICILTFVVPFVIMWWVVFPFVVPTNPLFVGMFFNGAITIFLVAVSAYCIGLQIGWQSNKIVPLIGGLLLMSVFLPIAVVKGFMAEGICFLVVFIAASMIRVWHKFKSVSL